MCGFSLREFESELRMYDGDDPLDVWDRWVNYENESVEKKNVLLCKSRVLSVILKWFCHYQVYKMDRANVPSGRKGEQPRHAVGASRDKIQRWKEIFRRLPLCWPMDQICMYWLNLFFSFT